VTSVQQDTPASAGAAPLRTRVRAAALAGGCAAALALALAGCGSGGDDAKGGADGGASADASSPAASAGGSGSEAGSGSGSKAEGSLEGSWVATTGGKTVALVISSGKAGLFDSGGSTCSGTGGDESGMQMIHLTCTDGSKDRADGMVDSVSGTTLKVKWSGLGAETFTKSTDGKLPEGLPTASAPSS
jgi:hypothetical protein